MTILNKLKLAVLVLVVTFNFSCSSDDGEPVDQTPNGIATVEQLSAYLENLVNTKDVPGFSVNVAVENTVVFNKSFGYANIASKTPYTNQTINNMASVSKAFLGAATAKAIEQGYFTLDTPINDVLPVEIRNPKQPNANIKIKDLVTHTSGIVDVPSTYLASNYFILPGQPINTNAANIMINDLGMQQMEQVDLDDYLIEIFTEDGDLYNLDNYLDAAPGTTWSYSNDASSLMGFIIEYVSDQSFDDYVKEYVLMPLQMTNSTFNLSEVDFSAMATQYLDNNSEFPRYGNHGYVEGGLHSNSDDMSKFLLDMMKGARGEASTLFASEYYDLMFTNQLASGVVPNSFAENHGLYWYMKNGNIIHGGNSLGVSTHLQLKQDGSSGFCIITNMDGTFTNNTPKWEEVKLLISQAVEQFISNN
ncbi:serine hydrolase domain-containing protein [Seonamhaeicola marinus]|uniref:Beta-lactamase family protein n=1 Tax=Seonamhaeicola marinus TaxID=1912246 RepID=A0A5D0IAD1_9FLAO|nr:serine hydrolase domain-containing protein [Seonamhaeicola marinus]TYA78732.1 beta-lactamase family protein [Seonamhaeicola marinus]